MTNNIRRPPTHPNGIIQKKILVRYSLSQAKLAKALGVSRRTLDGIMNEERGLTAKTALRIAKLTNTKARFWLDLQKEYDLWQAEQKIGDELDKIEPLIDA